MKWRIEGLLLVAVVTLYALVRNSAFVLAFLSVCGGFAWHDYQQKMSVLGNDNEGDEEILKDIELFFLCCLATFLSGTVWGIIHGYGWWSALTGVANLALFVFIVMVFATNKVRVV